MTQELWDVIVVGGGSAGLSAALTLGRARRRVLVADSGAPRNRFAAHTQGLLGQDGVTPSRLLKTGRDEARGYGVELTDATVERVEETDSGLRVVGDDGSDERCRALIVASGMADHLPDIPGLAPRWGRTVLHCPYCHGWEVRDQRLGVLATSPLALHQVQLVRQWSERVTFFAADAGQLEDGIRRRLGARGIRIVDSPLAEVLGEAPGLSGVRTGDGEVVALDALFTGGSSQPHDSFLDAFDLARTDTPVGSFLAVDEMGKTSHDRIWAAGNVADPAANVARAISGGVRAAAAVNMFLVTEDFDLAERAAAVARDGGR